MATKINMKLSDHVRELKSSVDDHDNNGQANHQMSDLRKQTAQLTEQVTHHCHCWCQCLPDAMKGAIFKVVFSQKGGMLLCTQAKLVESKTAPQGAHVSLHVAFTYL